MMGYKVVFVGDDELPQDRDWVLVGTECAFFAFVKQSRASSPEVLGEAWAGFVSYLAHIDNLGRMLSA